MEIFLRKTSEHKGQDQNINTWHCLPVKWCLWEQGVCLGFWSINRWGAYGIESSVSHLSLAPSYYLRNVGLASCFLAITICGVFFKSIFWGQRDSSSHKTWSSVPSSHTCSSQQTQTHWGGGHGPASFPWVSLRWRLRQEGHGVRLDLCLKRKRNCPRFCC